MALVLADRVQETTVTTGTGTITLAGAVTGFQTFAVVGNGNTTYYTLISGSNWESGIGTYSTSGPTLARTTILASSNAGSPITLSGTSTIFLTGPSSRSVLRDGSNILTLDAGTATVPPLDFQAGTNLTTALAGAVEYDGKVLYATPQGEQRGVVPGMQYYRLNAARAGANATGAQSFLGVGVTLSSNTVYAFEAYYPMSKTAGTTLHIVSLLFGGTATVNNIGYSVLSAGNSSSSFISNANMGISITYMQVATASAITGNNFAVNPAILHAKISGTVSVNTGGTFIPQYQLSVAPGGAWTVALGAYFLIYPIGAAGANTAVGTWA
jgi:hypothetical protein